MGREASCDVTWRGRTDAARVLLEGDALILRGPLRTRISRAALGPATVENGSLRVATPEGPLVLHLGERQAAGWAAALSRPPPDLAQKLGLGDADGDGDGARAFLVGPVTDAAALAALAGREATDPASAALAVVELASQADLDRALAFAAGWPGLPLWCLHPRGRGATPPDAAIRAAFRAAGHVDVKASAVSEARTATLYRRRGG